MRMVEVEGDAEGLAFPIHAVGGKGDEAVRAAYANNRYF